MFFRYLETSRADKGTIGKPSKRYRVRCFECNEESKRGVPPICIRSRSIPRTDMRNRTSSTGKPTLNPGFFSSKKPDRYLPAIKAKAPASTTRALCRDNTLLARIKNPRYATRNTLGSNRSLFITIISMVLFNKRMRMNLLLAILSIILLFSVYTSNKEPGVYKGTEIYVLALDLKEAKNQTIQVEGIYLKNNTKAELEGKLIEIGKGNLLIATDEGILTIGGSLAGKEDIAAKRIIVK